MQASGEIAINVYDHVKSIIYMKKIMLEYCYM